MTNNVKTIVDELRKRGLSNGTTIGYHSGLMDEAADTIEQLQAEIEKKNEDIEKWQKVNFDLCIAGGKLLRERKTIRAEAIKEFAEKYKDQIKNYTGMFTDNGFMVSHEAILAAVDFIKEQLVGEN